jgi:hypothetical protein
MSLCPPPSPPIPCPPTKAWVNLEGMKTTLSKGSSPLPHVRRMSRLMVGLKPALSKGLSPRATSHALRRVPTLAGTPSRQDKKVVSLRTRHQSAAVLVL